MIYYPKGWHQLSAQFILSLNNHQDCFSKMRIICFYPPCLIFKNSLLPITWSLDLDIYGSFHLCISFFKPYHIFGIANDSQFLIYVPPLYIHCSPCWECTSPIFCLLYSAFKAQVKGDLQVRLSLTSIGRLTPCYLWVPLALCIYFFHLFIYRPPFLFFTCSFLIGL